MVQLVDGPNSSASSTPPGLPGASTNVARLFYKAGRYGGASNSNTAPGVVVDSNDNIQVSTLSNKWVEVGSKDWQRAIPVMQSLVIDGNITVLGSATTLLTINGQAINASSLTGFSSGHPLALTAANLAQAINTSHSSTHIPGVYAQAYNGTLYLYATSAADSSGANANTSSADGGVLVVYGSGSALTTSNLGLPTTVQGSPYFFYGDYASAPTTSGGAYQGWGLSSTDPMPRPSSSVWWKTSALGGGWNPALKVYSQTSGQWQAVDPIEATKGISDAAA